MERPKLRILSYASQFRRIFQSLNIVILYNGVTIDNITLLLTLVQNVTSSAKKYILKCWKKIRNIRIFKSFHL